MGDTLHELIRSSGLEAIRDRLADWTPPGDRQRDPPHERGRPGGRHPRAAAATGRQHLRVPRPPDPGGFAEGNGRQRGRGHPRAHGARRPHGPARGMPRGGDQEPARAARPGAAPRRARPARLSARQRRPADDTALRRDPRGVDGAGGARSHPQGRPRQRDAQHALRRRRRRQPDRRHQRARVPARCTRQAGLADHGRPLRRPARDRQRERGDQPVPDRGQEGLAGDRHRGRPDRHRNDRRRAEAWPRPRRPRRSRRSAAPRPSTSPT